MDVVEQIPEIFQKVSTDPALPRDDIKPAEPAKAEETKVEEPKADEQPKEDPIPKGVQKRIDRAVRQKYEAEARAKMLEERLSHLEKNVAPQQTRPAAEGMPTIDKFDNFDDYVAAKAEFIAKNQIENTLNEREKRQQAERAQAEHKKVSAEWESRVSKATAEMPDFEEVVASSEVPMTDAMQAAIMESEIGPKLAYYLAQNPEEASKIAGMSPSGAIRTIGRIEERLSAIQKTTVTPVPPPPTSIGSRASVKKSPAQMTDEEYAKWRKKL